MTDIEMELARVKKELAETKIERDVEGFDSLTVIAVAASVSPLFATWNLNLARNRSYPV